MAEPIKTVQSQPNPDPISVPVGGLERAPASVVAPEVTVQGVEQLIRPSEPEPQISTEVAAVGVESVPLQPQLHPSAQASGLNHSIPIKPDFGGLPTDPVVIEENLQAPIDTATPWRALLVKINNAKQQIQGLFSGQPLKPRQI